MSIALPADLQRFVDQEVASGAYNSSDELITTAIQLLREHQVRYAQLKADIEQGLQGEGIPAEKVFAELESEKCSRCQELMAMKVEFSADALRDLHDILEYVARDNPQAAVRLIDRMEATSLRLADTPKVGTRRDDLTPGLRALAQGNYVIYFVSEGDDLLRIVRVLHGARDVRPVDFRPSSMNR